MGGAIAVHAAARKLIPSIVGLVVIDVVEGKTASEVVASIYITSSKDLQWRLFRRCKVF